MTDDPRAIAEGLTEARRYAVLNATCVARRPVAECICGVNFDWMIDERLAESDGRIVKLTPLGLQVRAILQERQS